MVLSLSSWITIIRVESMRYIKESKNRRREAELTNMTPSKRFRDAESFLRWVSENFGWNPGEDMWESNYGIAVTPVSSNVYLNMADDEGNINPDVFEDMESVLVVGTNRQGEVTGSVYIDPEDIKTIGISKYMFRFESKRGTVVDIIGTAR